MNAAPSPEFLKAADLIGREAFAEAEVLLEGAIEQGSADTDLYEALARVYDKTDQDQKGESICRRWSELDPSSVMAYTNLSVFLQKLNRIEDAEAAKTQATVAMFRKTAVKKSA